MFQVCPGRWAKPLMSRQAPKPRGKSGDAEKCHQVTCISPVIARHCPSLISHLNSCHLYITSITYATQLTHVISHLSHFPSSRSHMISPRLTKPTSAKFSCNLFDFVWTVMDSWTHGLMGLSFFPFVLRNVVGTGPGWLISMTRWYSLERLATRAKVSTLEFAVPNVGSRMSPLGFKRSDRMWMGENARAI